MMAQEATATARFDWPPPTAPKPLSGCRTLRRPAAQVGARAARRAKQTGRRAWSWRGVQRAGRRAWAGVARADRWREGGRAADGCTAARAGGRARRQKSGGPVAQRSGELAVGVGRRHGGQAATSAGRNRHGRTRSRFCVMSTDDRFYARGSPVISRVARVGFRPSIGFCHE